MKSQYFNFTKGFNEINKAFTLVLNYKNLLNEFYQSFEFNLINSSK